METDAEKNKRILKTGLDMWSKSGGTEEAAKYWFGLVDEKVKWRSIVDERTPGMEFAVDCDSKDGVERYFHRLGELWEMESCIVDDYIAEGDRVVVIGTVKWKNRTTGKSVETRKADVFKMKNGKIVEFCEFF